MDNGVKQAVAKTIIRSEDDIFERFEMLSKLIYTGNEALNELECRCNSFLYDKDEDPSFPEEVETPPPTKIVNYLQNLQYDLEQHIKKINKLIDRTEI